MSAIQAWSKGAKNQSAGTPRPLFRELELRFGRGRFDLDAAAAPNNHLCPAYFTRSTDALAEHREWRGRVFCNPPYEDLEPWLWKAFVEVECRHAEVVVMLLPARLRWMSYARKLGGTIHEIEGRVRFNGAGHRPFESSMVVVFERPLKAADFREANPGKVVQKGGRMRAAEKQRRARARPRT